MKVLKFGGTSVGTVESLLNVKKIVEAENVPVIVVVSALGGLTDKLIATARMAAESNSDYIDEWESMSERHHRIIDAVVPSARHAEVSEIVDSLLRDLRKNYDGIYLIGDLPPRTLDVIVSFGERMSSEIVAAMIENGKKFDSLEFMKTEKWYSKNIADRKLIPSLVKDSFKDLDCRAIVPGFISTDRDNGEITNLGRGGSDFTAALIAAALDAEVLEIWTDVDGFMTADPRIIKDATVVGHMTFIESMELCNFGAKVIYPPTIHPVFHKNIPIRILNTFNPVAEGTLITETPFETDIPVKGVSSMKGISLFIIKGKDAIDASVLGSRATNALARKGVSIGLASRNDRDGEVAFSVSDSDSPAALSILRDEFAPELTRGVLSGIVREPSLAAIAVVGENMTKQHCLAGRIQKALENEGIMVRAFSHGASETTISFLVAIPDMEQSLKIVHSLVF